MTRNPTFPRLISRPRDIPASDGFGPLPPTTPAPRNRSLTRGLCTFLGWPYRRSPRATPLRQPSPRATAPTLRAVNE